MKKILVVGAVLVAVVALAGQAAKDTNGAPPSDLGPSANAEKLGVTMAGAVGCRMSGRIDAGTDAIGTKGFAASGWRMVPWYYDNANGWVEGNSSLHCVVEARLDAGTIRALVCPDLIPAARFGRMSVSTYGAVGFDGGTGADLINDAGIGPLPRFRVECWGPALTGT